MGRATGDAHEANEGIPVVPLPAARDAIARATQFRSTWIIASLDGLRQSNYFDRYAALLGAHREQLLTCLAGAWLPMAAARAHYEACEQLYIPEQRYLEMVRNAAQVRQAWHAPLIAGAENAAATPWTVLASLPRGWGRTADGGAIAIHKLGPNLARIECVGCELFDVAYFRRAVRVNFQLLLERVCERLILQELSDREDGTCCYSALWTEPQR